MLTQALVVSGPMDFNAENGTKKKMCGLSALQVIYSQERSEEKFSVVTKVIDVCKVIRFFMEMY